LESDNRVLQWPPEAEISGGGPLGSQSNRFPNKAADEDNTIGRCCVEDDIHVGLGVQPKPLTWFTPKDLQQELRIGERLVYRLLKDGTIPSVRLGGMYRINRKHLEEFLLAEHQLGKSE
jgi:excisionase family DNA binding protein